jgi:hypothetical protein
MQLSDDAFIPDTFLVFIPRYARGKPTACVTRVWAGVDKVWEQKKLEARKMLVNRADSHTSGARFVGHFTERKTRCPKKDTTAFIHYFPALTKTVF